MLVLGIVRIHFVQLRLETEGLGEELEVGRDIVGVEERE